MPQFESFCAAVEGVACEGCPLGSLTEDEITAVAQPGTAPDEFADALGDALSAALIDPDEREDVEAAVYDAAEDTGDPLDIAEVTAVTAGNALSSLYAAEVLVAHAVDDEETPFARELTACLWRDHEGDCTYYEDEVRRADEPQELFAETIGPEEGARLIAQVARHGTPEEVRKMIGAVNEWASRIGRSSAEGTDEENRLRLIEIAEQFGVGGPKKG